MEGMAGSPHWIRQCLVPGWSADNFTVVCETVTFQCFFSAQGLKGYAMMEPRGKKNNLTADTTVKNWLAKFEEHSVSIFSQCLGLLF